MNILLIAENQSFQKVFAEKFSGHKKEVKIHFQDNLRSSDNIHKNLKIDFIFYKESISDFCCKEILERIKKNHKHRPLIVLSENPKSDKAVLYMKAGAFDYISSEMSYDDILEKLYSYTQTDYPWQRGYEINGYILQDLVSETPTSLVFQAIKKNDPNLYAVKAIKPEEIQENNLALTRFRREVEVLNKMDHPNIVQILHFDIDQDGIPYMIMPYLKGPTLSEIMKNIREIDFLNMMLALLDTLWDVHKHNIVHRDLKPENIMIYNNHPVLLDFGAVLIRHDLGLTHESHIIGTPNYIAPETFSENIKVDYRADIYSFGIILYEYVYKKCPFDGKSFREIYRNLHTLENKDLFLGSKYDNLIKGLINRDPKERHDSVLTIAEELTKIKLSI